MSPPGKAAPRARCRPGPAAQAAAAHGRRAGAPHRPARGRGPRPSVPMVHVRLRIPTAVSATTTSPAPAARATMLLGTAERSQGELAEAMQAIGGSLRVIGDADRLVLAGESLRAGLGELLGLLAEVLTGATYPKAPVEGEAAPAGRPAPPGACPSPACMADEAWLHRMYGDHPYGREHPAPTRCWRCPATSLRAAHRAGWCPTAACWCWSVTSPRPARWTRSAARWPAGSRRRPDHGAEGAGAVRTGR